MAVGAAVGLEQGLAEPFVGRGEPKLAQDAAGSTWSLQDKRCWRPVLRAGLFRTSVIGGILLATFYDP
jgi:hypothetical protein